MLHDRSEDGQPFVDRSLWAEPLFKFAQVSRLVISLYDRQGRRWCGPCFSQGLAARLAREGIWNEGGFGHEHEKQLVERCVSSGKTVHENVLGLLGQLALPCRHQGEIVLVLVLGWAPQQDVDAAGLKELAGALNLPLDEVWQLVRTLPPISEDRLRMHGHMLEIFSSSLLQHRTIHGWEVLSDTAFALAEATTEHDICQIAHRALRSLLRDAYCVIKLVAADGPAGYTRVHENEDRALVSLMPHVQSVRQHLSIPILARRDQLLGQIEVTLDLRQPVEPYRETLSILAGQVGVALQNGRADRRRSHGKDDFLATVSHTLKRSARRQSRLIADLLDMSQMIAGGMSLENEDLDAVAILLTTLESVRPMMQLRQQKLETRLPSGPLFVRGDRQRLHQVFWNLISNASKFTQDGGLISISLEAEGPLLRFEVKDSGKGIAAADLPGLFSSVHPGRAPSASANAGLGLGLAIVRHLVEMHGGSVSVQSEGEGRGATFTVLLPRSCASDHSQRLRGS